MSARSILEDLVERTGWNESSLLFVACSYIDNQKDEEAFRDFATQMADEEDKSLPEV